MVRPAGQCLPSGGRELEAELCFYARIFHFDLPEPQVNTFPPFLNFEMGG